MNHSHLITPRLPLAPTKISEMQVAFPAGLVHHSGSMVKGQVPQVSGVPIREVPMPTLPGDLEKVKGTPTRRPMGHVQMEQHGSHRSIPLCYIG
jgi:hypothetical protein